VGRGAKDGSSSSSGSRTADGKQRPTDALVDELLQCQLVTREDVGRDVATDSASGGGADIGRVAAATTVTVRKPANFGRGGTFRGERGSAPRVPWGQIRDYLASSRLVGMSSSDAMRRQRELCDVGIDRRSAAVVALSLPWVSDVAVTDKHRGVINELRDFGVDIAAVLRTQPATLCIPVETVRERLESLVDAGFTRSDTAAIV
jgi:hypothetical protein